VLNSPIGLVFQLYEEVAGLNLDESKWGGANRSFESRELSPKSVSKLIYQTLS